MQPGVAEQSGQSFADRHSLLQDTVLNGKGKKKLKDSPTVTFVRRNALTA